MPEYQNTQCRIFFLSLQKDSTMYRIGLAVLGFLLLACGGNDEKKEENTNGGDTNRITFDDRFQSTSPPYQLTDTSLLSNTDTASLPAQQLAQLVPDSITKKIFGKSIGIKFTPLAKLNEKDKDAYYVIKGTAGSKKAALLMVVDKNGNYGAAMPFLVPDAKAATSQTSVIDKSYAIIRTISQRSDVEAGKEGKEVLAYDAKEKRFTLIMTDMLNDRPDVLVNPLDTFPKTHRLAGDYFVNKKNLIAIRDGRYPNQILVYIHTENADGDCRGELKGEFIMTGATTAVYRQGGDPCVLGLTFKGNSVTMNEESGCGNYRGLDCPLSGTFTRKKEEKPKETTKKSKQPKRPQ
jgi:hypothetical protein